MADSVTTLPSFSDPRNAMPQRPGHIIKRVRCGYSTTSGLRAAGRQLVPQRAQARRRRPRARTAGSRTWSRSLVYVNDANHPDGTVANLDTDAMMHHFVLINRQRPDPVCPGGLQGQIGERVLRGRQRAQPDAPAGAVRLSEQPLDLVADLARRQQGHGHEEPEHRARSSSTAPRAARTPSRCGSTSTAACDSEYTTPIGYSRRHRRLDLDRQRAPDRHGRPHARRRHHELDARAPTTARRRGTASPCRPSWWAATATTTSGPFPPNNSPPASLTGATLCRSEAYYGTPWAGTQIPRPPGHDEPMRDHHGPPADRTGGGLARPAASCRRPAIRSTPGRPSGCTASTRTTPAQPQTDVMGIMLAWYVPTSPGYPRPEGATPTRVVAGARLHPVHEPEPDARPARLPGQRLQPRRLLQPAGPDLVTADGRHAGRERRAAPTSLGSVQGRRARRQPRDARRRGRRARHGLDHRRAQAAPTSPTTRASCSSTPRCG